MHLALKLFIEVDENFAVGPGRIELLRSVRELGSLLQASKKMGMSYRWAWGRLKKTEEILGIPLLTKCAKGALGRPNNLTPEAEELLEWYSQAEDSLKNVLGRIEADMPESLAGRILPLENETMGTTDPE